jgi:putative CocE/NonD family hydrolase
MQKLFGPAPELLVEAQPMRPSRYRLIGFRATLVGVLWGSLIAATGGNLLDAAQGPSVPEYQVEMQEAWIGMPDGVGLAADLYMPAGDVKGKTFPVILEYLPYRKTESRARNHALYSYFVERGYVVARVDIRGTGNSEGRLIPYEYSDQEHQDGMVVIDWLARQPWSNGNVGMFGISWGGFNSIQMARLNPPALKAIIAVDATEDLYQDDVHYMDGIMHVDSWEMSQDLDNARPGAPDYVIDEAYFRDRFDTQPWMMTYKHQQRDGAFWDRASVRGRYEEIKIPTFHIGGWYDGYRDSLPRMLENLEAPVKAMIGPWSHAWPHDPYPSPGVEWRHEAVRWFDQWLKGVDTGIMDEPRFAVYIRQWHPPGPYLETAPGFWRWEDGWPVQRIEQRVMHPQPNHTLSTLKPEKAVHQLRCVPSIGVEAGGPVMWWGDVAHDQRGTDAFSLFYDSEALSEDTEILGLPRAVLQVAASAPRANWYVRLSDVAPDGTVTQVAGAGFNGAHRISARRPEDIEPGQVFPLDIEMHFTSWVFPKGHRIRFSVNNAQWPMLWPTPYTMTTSLQLGGESGSHVVIPVVPPGPATAPEFWLPTESPELPGFESLDPGTNSGYGEVSSVDRNPQTGEVTVTATSTGAIRYPWGTETYRETIEHRTSDAHPENTEVCGTHRMEVTLEDRVLLWEAELSFTSDRDNFYYHYTRRLEEDGELVREKTWTDTIPRDFQ